MPKTSVTDVDDYLSRHPARVRSVLERVRRTIRRALPDAEEVISYSIPAYRLHGRVVIFFAGWKEHVSIYPAIGQAAEIFADEFARYKVSKGTLKFPLAEPIPLRLIANVAKVRAREAAEQPAAGTRPSTKRARPGRSSASGATARRGTGRRATPKKKAGA